jgi:hypothetical protein
MFAMGIYLLHDAAHNAMDKHRSRFFWEVVGDKQKYHMVDCSTMCKPKGLFVWDVAGWLSKESCSAEEAAFQSFTVWQVGWLPCCE